MGESKLPKKPPVRPGSSIFAMRSSVSGWKSQAMGSDPDTDDFMRDLEKVLAWVDELEAATDPFAKVVPLISPELPDETPLHVAGLTTDHSISAGDFRRLNPNATKPPKLDA